MCKFESSQKMKAEPSRLIPRKLAANLESLIIQWFLTGGGAPTQGGRQ